MAWLKPVCGIETRYYGYYINNNINNGNNNNLKSCIAADLYRTNLRSAGKHIRVRSSLRLTTTSGRGSYRRFNHVRSEAAETMATEKLGIKIVHNPPETKLSDLGVRSWPKWGCPPSKFPWTYSSKETCYMLKGKVKVYPDGFDEAVEIGAGDLVVFPKGMSCTWDVSEAVDKHYAFD